MFVKFSRFSMFFKVFLQEVHCFLNVFQCFSHDVHWFFNDLFDKSLCFLNALKPLISMRSQWIPLYLKCSFCFECLILGIGVLDSGASISNLGAWHVDVDWNSLELEGLSTTGSLFEKSEAEIIFFIFRFKVWDRDLWLRAGSGSWKLGSCFVQLFPTGSWKSLN